MNKMLALLLISFLGLEGCVPVLVGATAAGAGGATYYTKNGISQFLDDSAISKSAYRRLERHPELLQASHIVVTVKNGYVLLVGQVPNPSYKSEAENAIRSVEGVRMIYNQLTISGPTSDLVRSSDSWITAKIKSQLVLAKNVPANQIKVVTENGVVYLLGNQITLDAQEAAVNIARQVLGVQKVVKLFN